MCLTIIEKAAEQKKLARMEEALAHKAEIEAVKEAAAGLDQKALSYITFALWRK